MQADDLKDYAVARGENVAEINTTLLETALVYADSYTNGGTAAIDPTPQDILVASYGIYKQLLSGGAGGAYSGFEVQQGGYSFKTENDIPYNSRRILDRYKVVRAF